MRRAKTVGEDFLNHCSAAKEWRYGIEEFFPAIEHADTGGSVDFVAGEHEEVAINILHVDCGMRCKLRSIEERKGTVFVCKRNELFIGSESAKDIAYRGNRKEFHLSLFQNSFCIFHIQRSIFFDADPFNFDSDFLFQLEPWNNVRMV